MIKLTVLYSYDKAVAKLSKVYSVSKQTVKDHFDDMNVELSYQVRKAFGREYLYYMIKQSDIEECRHWLNTHKEELAKVEKLRNNSGYTLDNHKDEPLHFNTQREIADFLGYKATGFVIGRVYRGYELQRGSVPENNSIINTNTGESIPNETIANSDTSTDTEMAKSAFEMASNDTEMAKSIVNDTTSTDTEMVKSAFEMASIDTEMAKSIANSDTSNDTEMASNDTEMAKSDFESKIDAYFSKYYDLD